MGMYTEVLVKCDIRTDIDPVDKAALEYLFNRETDDAPDVLPTHAFFSTARWMAVGAHCSFYHVPWVDSRFGGDHGATTLFSRSDLKNYHGEVEAFFDWLRPLVDGEPGDCIGWQWYEEDRVPTLVLV